MSLYVGVNGTPKKVKKLFVGVNGTPKEVKTGYTGGVNSSVNKVYSTSIEDQLTQVNPIAALTSGKITSAHIGKTVYLSNSAITCQEWVIADVNHDGTSGTVDLFSKTTLTNDFLMTYYNTNSSIYKDGDLNRYLESTVYNGFVAEVKNTLNNMNVASNGEILQRHVVAPSITEMGNNLGRWQHMVLEEGNIYPIFSPACNPNPKNIFKTPNGNGADYWIRTRYGNDETDNYHYAACCIYSNGSADNFNIHNTSCYVIARIRFAKA